jgi:hypothetical protein
MSQYWRYDQLDNQRLFKRLGLPRGRKGQFAAINRFVPGASKDSDSVEALSGLKPSAHLG